MKLKRPVILFISFVAVVLLSITMIFISKKLFIPQETHYHAGFVVFKNDKKINFSDVKYMFLEPCTLNKNNDNSPTDIQIEKAHLHDNVGDVVHIERTGAKWQDLFTNIHFLINYSKTTGYINGEKVANYQLQPIKPDDILVVFIGKEDQKLIRQAVTKDYIEKMAKKSTTCGD